MKSGLRSLSGIILFVCLTAPVIGIYIGLQIKKENHRKNVYLSVLKTLPENELTNLSFSGSDASDLLNWKEVHEFEYLGTMYDVVSMENSNDSVFIICWCDNEETSLNKQIKQLVKGTLNQNQTDKKNSNTVFRFLKTLYWESTNNSIPFSELKSQKQFTIYINHYKSVFKENSSPPPWQYF